MADVRMTFIGDTYVQRSDPDAVFAVNQHLFDGSDIFFCNLETVVADEKYLPPHDPMRRFPRTDECLLASYLKAGINVMNIANNPVLYHGRECFVRSLEVLEAAGVVYGGGGRNITEARRPATIEKNGLRIAFVCRVSVCPTDAGATASRPGLAYFKVATAYEPKPRHFEVPGSAPIIHTIPDLADRDALAEDIALARAQADIVAVSWHWGVSPASGGTGELAGYQREMGHFAIDAGADMVIGHHPHLLQPIEVYKGKPIVYSLGNYCHDMEDFGHMEFMAMVLRCEIRDGRLSELSFTPGHLRGNGPPDFSDREDRERTAAHMERISSPFGTRFARHDRIVKVLLS